MEHRTTRVNGIRLHYVTDGEGPPVVLLHGWPQTWYHWRKVIPTLARRYTVIAPDLRGYGDSDKPASGYDKRTMASDVHELVRGLGHATIRLVGHDRGARVAHRYALDYGDELERLVLLDIVPTLVAFERLDAGNARGYWHWLFHMVPDPPELLVGGNVEGYLRHFFGDWAYQTAVFTPEDVAVYVRAFSLPGALRAGFEDYRAGGTIDLMHDRADAGRRVKTPTLVLWATEGGDAKQDVLDTWRAWADDVRGEGIPDCGHFLAEEQPQIVSAKLLQFLGLMAPFHAEGGAGSLRVVEDSAFEVLVSTHHGEIYRYLLRTTGRTSDADDLSQDTFLRAYRAYRALPKDANARAWLFTIATNLSRNHFRSQSRRRRAYEAVGAGVRETDGTAAPDGVLLGREAGAALEAAVGRLPFKQRAAFLQRKIHGLEYDAIGRSLGCSAESARAHVFQALRKIRLVLNAPQDKEPSR